MSDQRVTPSQRELIIRTLQTMLDDEGLSPAGVDRVFREWCERKNRDCDLSKETIRKWCAVAKGEGRKLKTEPAKAGQLINFALEHEKRLNPDDFEGMLIRSAQYLFGSGNNTTSDHLKRLHGRFLIIRRRWRRPLEETEFTQCIVDFEITHDRAIFRETQKLGSVGSRATDRINEEYTGYAFMFGSNAFILAHEKSRTSVKFLTIHFCEPPLLHGNSSIETCRGNLVAVCGPGPNKSHRFVLIRTTANSKCEYLRKSQLSNIMDKEEIDYLCSPHEKA